MASDGYISQELTPELKNVSCEACHGRGDHHVKLENDEKVKLEKIGMKKTDCITCHDKENSPEFNEEEYWEKITHGLDEVKSIRQRTNIAVSFLIILSLSFDF